MTDEEFYKLLEMKKEFINSTVRLPKNGEKGVYDLISVVTSDKFTMDVDRNGKIELSKFKIQNRYANTKLPLVRIEINSPPHINPDGIKISRNHIHIYKHMENDTGNLPWAYELSEFTQFSFEDGLDFMKIFDAFCNYCNIETNNIQGVI